MRFHELAAILFCVLASPAFAQAPKQVEVINEPLAVEVVNPTPPSPPARFQLVGFTTTEFGNFLQTAGVPSLFEMIAACQAEVDPASRMCRVDDIQLTTVIPSELPTVDEHGFQIRAWLTPDPANIGINATNCNGWAGGTHGLTVDARGQVVSKRCDEFRPVACCALVP